MMRIVCLFVLLLTVSVSAFDPNTLPVVGYHPSGLSYWNTPYFSNAFYNGKWLEFGAWEWGKSLQTWDNPQFDANGYPRYLNPGKQLRGICFGLHVNYGGARPETWPKRSGLAEGRVVLTWQGDADIRLGHGQFLSADSSGNETGSLVNGRRVYLFENGRHLQTLEVYAINSENPITDIKVWLADPDQPVKQSLENSLFHPTFLDRIADADWGFIRFMNLLQTNANPQQDWSDRRLPSHCFMAGPLNPREPAAGFHGQRGTGMAFEYMVSLCNQTNKDLWLCIPHLATDDFVRRLAQLIRYGSDGHEPYTKTVTNPVYPPLDSHLRVYVEYSNEIWSQSNSFPQGNWAQAQGKQLGLSKAQFNARRFCQLWRIFEDTFKKRERLVNVAAVFTASENYTRPYLEEIASYGPRLNVQPDIIAVTTYFGNGIQDFVYQTAQDQAGTDDPWCFTTETFGIQNKPVSLGPKDAYWTSEVFTRHLDITLAEWRKRLLSGDAREGAGPDAVGVGGGFHPWLREHIQTTFGRPVPIVAYEGGPSIYTDNIDAGDARDDGITIFMEALNRHPGFRDVYNIHLNMAHSKGLWTHVAFTDCGSWGKYGQWGHLEYLDEEPSSSSKWQFLLDWMEDRKNLRHIDQPCGKVPQFETAHHLPIAVVGHVYNTPIHIGGGDGTLDVEVVGTAMVPGIKVAVDRSDVRIQGTPQEAGISYIYLRVIDRDGDPAWRTFTVRSVGGPNVLVESNFSGNDPAKHLPWTNTYVLAKGVRFLGWTAGGGSRTHTGDNQIVWSVAAPAQEAEATLSLAIKDKEYLAMTLESDSLDLRKATVTLSLRRLDYHAPRRLSVLTNVEGFAEEAVVFTSPYNRSEMDQEFRFTLPDHPIYDALNASFELRLYGYSGQYGGHRLALQRFQIETK